MTRTISRRKRNVESELKKINYKVSAILAISAGSVTAAIIVIIVIYSYLDDILSMFNFGDFQFPSF